MFGLSRDQGRLLGGALLALNLILPQIVSNASVYRLSPQAVVTLSILISVVTFVVSGLPTVWKSKTED